MQIKTTSQITLNYVKENAPEDTSQVKWVRNEDIIKELEKIDATLKEMCLIEMLQIKRLIEQLR